MFIVPANAHPAGVYEIISVPTPAVVGLNNPADETPLPDQTPPAGVAFN